MGVVYLARHLAWDTNLAIKHHRADFLRSAKHRCDFINECETWSNLGLHPYGERLETIINCVDAALYLPWARANRK